MSYKYSNFKEGYQDLVAVEPAMSVAASAMSVAASAAGVGCLSEQPSAPRRLAVTRKRVRMAAD